MGCLLHLYGCSQQFFTELQITQTVTYQCACRSIRGSILGRYSLIPLLKLTVLQRDCFSLCITFSVMNVSRQFIFRIITKWAFDIIGSGVRTRSRSYFKTQKRHNVIYSDCFVVHKDNPLFSRSPQWSNSSRWATIIRAACLYTGLDSSRKLSLARYWMFR